MNYFPPATVDSKNQAGAELASESEVPAPVIVLSPAFVLSHLNTGVMKECNYSSSLMIPLATCSLYTSSSLLGISVIIDLVQSVSSGACNGTSKYMASF